MEWVIISLLSLSTLLFIISFFQKGAADRTEKQVEQVSIQLMQEIYHLKKKVRKLEEEYMIEYDAAASPANKTSRLKRDDVLAMFENGHTPEDIAINTNRSIKDIEDLLADEKQ